jgi:hypothetical protein
MLNFTDAALRQAPRLRALKAKGTQLSDQDNQLLTIADQYEAARKLSHDSAVERAAAGNTLALRTNFAAAGGGDLTRFLDEGTQGYTNMKVMKLLSQHGHLDDADEIYFATVGAGSDDAKIKEVLKDKSREDIVKLRDQYNARYDHGAKSTFLDVGAMTMGVPLGVGIPMGGEDFFGHTGRFDEDILGDLSGRDAFDVGQMLEHGNAAKRGGAQGSRRRPSRIRALRVLPGDHA